MYSIAYPKRDWSNKIIVHSSLYFCPKFKENGGSKKPSSKELMKIYNVVPMPIST